MTTIELLSNLRDLNVKLWVDGERLRYSAPTGTLGPELLKQLAAHKPELINFLREATAASGPPPIEPAGRDGELPLSYAQQRLWILDRLNPDSSAYYIPIVLRLEGRLDVEALRRSFGELVKRHESLRTVFTETDGWPSQTILPALELDVPVVDLSRFSNSEREAEFQRIAAEYSRRPFDLAHGPLIRAIIVKLDDEEHALCVTLHHIVSDGWSSGVLVREFAALYEAFHAGHAPSLPPLKVQYADFAIWQRDWLRSGVMERQIAYWKRQLGGDLSELELPADKARPAQPTFGGATEVLQLPRPLLASLNELARRENVTLFMLLLACFQAQLSRYAGQDEVVVGTPIANRVDAELEPLIGFFVNTLVLRTNLSGDPTFRELLARVKEVTLGAYANQDVPFERLVEELQPERRVTRTPFFQVAFVLQNAPMQPLRLPELTITLLPLDNGTAKFDLTLNLRESDEGLTAALEYNTDIFECATARQLLEHFGVLLAGVAKDPDLPVSRVPLMSEHEREELLNRCRAAVPEYRAGEPLHRLFEARVAAEPGAVALVCGDERLSYDELNVRANRLAHRLRRLGVGPETLVSVCLERSVEMVVALLGVLKAGGAYVPLDPASPPGRIAWILEDTRSPVLVTTNALVERLPPHAAQPVLLDVERESLASESGDNLDDLDGDATAHHLAYVIHTSGSTGRPKGTLVTHYNVVRLFQATQHWFNFTERDVWTLFHSYAFDFSVWELWGALLYGGRLVVVPYEVSRSPAAFYRMLVEEGVTVLNQTPSAFRQLIRTEEEAGVSPELNLRLIIFGGEALELRSLKPWLARHGDRRPRLVNMYGITETTVHVTYRLLAAADVERASASIIGGPIPDLELYVLDRHMQPVPVGVGGEVYVGGAGLARGYLGRAELTAERYVPHPYTERPGARLYRTGDLARQLASGDIEYLGRCDRQLKIRGHRIELGEIESALNEHPSVRDGVVVVAADSASDANRLIAYVVPRRDMPAPGADEFRRWLSRTLPEYMIPQAFVMLDALPLTANGKLDHKALPAVKSDRPELAQVYIAPRTHSEGVLADVWAEVLGLDRVGVHDNFFDLGGDSIRSIQVHSKAARRGLTFPLQEIFRCQTVAELAAIATDAEPERQPRASEPFSLVADEDRTRLPQNVEDAYPLALLQTGMIFHTEYSAASTAYVNVSSVHLRAPFSREVLVASLEQLARRHPILRTSFDLANFSEPLQLVHRDAQIPLAISDLRTLSAAEQGEVIDAWVDAEQSNDFDLSRAPLLRFQVHLRSDDTFQLSWTEHHAILDGWSLASMMTELFRLYFSLAGEVVAPVPPPPASTYRDFIACEREALSSEEHWRFWEEKLSGRSVLTLPRRAPSRSEADGQQTKHLIAVEPELSASLKRLAGSAGVPLKSVLLAAHLKVLSVLGNQVEVLTGLVCNGRLEEADGDRVLGLFLNTVPLCCRLDGGSWLELIRETFRVEQELMPFRRYPLAALQRKVGGTPLFETVFNFTHFHIYQGLREIPRLEILGAQSVAQTNYALLADFSVDPLTAEVSMRLEYNTANLSADDVEAIGGYYLRALEAMAGEPEEDYASRSLLSAAERHQLLSLWNDTCRDYPKGATVHGLFEEQAARTPDAEAVCFGGESVSYGELAARADRLARRLRRFGVGAESRVGVLMNRSTNLVAALLGVLKAGGAYVPLDAAYPAERLRYMLEDAGVSVLLTEGSLADLLGESTVHVVDLDRHYEEFDDDDVTGDVTGDATQLQVSDDNLAYVIYTSGSTGRPKGVAVTHRNVMRLVKGNTFADLNEREVLLQFAPVAFDASTFEIWGALLNGARLAVMPPGMPSLEELGAALRRHGVTTLWLTAGLFHLMVDERLEELKGVRQLLAGGDVLSVAHVRKYLREAVPGHTLTNGYGPTENTTFTCCHRMLSGDHVANSVPLGRPIANTQVYILDNRMQLVPVGTPGELYAGGDGLARGYLNRPALTAEQFVPHPFSVDPGARLYRTGDLARYLAGGQIEFLGRVDQQVKIRGFRIETGEIESVLLQHPQVRECVVVARENAPGEVRLVAYVVAHGDTPAAGALREHLKTKLPEYMVPSAFVLLKSLPLTPNGKVDRTALPPPAASESIASYVAPRDELEVRLCRIWEDALGVKSVGVKDDFFDLGGNSLLAVRLVAQMRKQFGGEVPINALFQKATIEQLAEQLAHAQRGNAHGGTPSPLVSIQECGEQAPLFCVHPIGGTVFCYLELSKSLGKGQPLYGLQAPGVYGEREPMSSVEELAAYYLGTVRELQAHGPYRLAGWSMGGVVAFEMAQQLRAQGEEVALLALIDSAVTRRAQQFENDDEEEVRLLSIFLHDLAAQRGKELTDVSEHLRRLASVERLAYVLEQAAAHDLLPPHTDPAHVEDLLKVFKCNWRALSSYLPRRYAGRLLLFSASESRDGGADATAGWATLAEEVKTFAVPGNHYTLMTRPNVETLAELLKSELEMVGEEITC